MPNHCEGTLTVSGPVEEIVKFREAVATQDPPPQTVPKQVLDRMTRKPEPVKNLLDARRIIPPDTGDASGPDYPDCDWCVAHWGTKWGFYDVNRQDNPRSSVYSFMTAWSPAEPVVLKMIEMFPKLRFRYEYYEGGMGFQGVISARNGEVTENSWNAEYKGHKGG
jgi:hypothetical protein